MAINSEVRQGPAVLGHLWEVFSFTDSIHILLPLSLPPKRLAWHLIAIHELFRGFIMHVLKIFYLYFLGEGLYMTRPCRDKPRQTNVTRRGKTPAGHKAT
jgi:hypothetical protein